MHVPGSLEQFSNAADVRITATALHCTAKGFSSSLADVSPPPDMRVRVLVRTAVQVCSPPALVFKFFNTYDIPDLIRMLQRLAHQCPKDSTSKSGSVDKKLSCMRMKQVRLSCGKILKSRLDTCTAKVNCTMHNFCLAIYSVESTVHISTSVPSFEAKEAPPLMP